MKKKARTFFIACIALLLGAQSAFAAPTLNPEALRLGLTAYIYAAKTGLVKKKILSIVDFTLPSNQKRLTVIDLEKDEILLTTYVAHGVNSGGLYARQFSNAVDSHESSLGTFITGSTYSGHWGYSLHLVGIEPNINNNAMKRDVVMHGDDVVTPSFISAHHESGTTWGCFGLSPLVSKKIIKLLSGGSVIFAYAPQEQNDPNLKTAKIPAHFKRLNKQRLKFNTSTQFAKKTSAYPWP